MVSTINNFFLTVRVYRGNQGKLLFYFHNSCMLSRRRFCRNGARCAAKNRLNFLKSWGRGRGGGGRMGGGKRGI